MYAVEFSNLSGPDGSALVSLGDTVVQATLHGPTEVKSSKEQYDKAVVEVSFVPSSGQSDCADRVTECYIRKAVESVVITSLFPRTSINIILQEIEDAGNILACSMNAAFLALLDAGIPMTHMLAASSIASVDNNLISFPTVEQQKLAVRMATVCFESPGGNIIFIKNSTFTNDKDLKSTIKAARTSAKELFEFFRNAASKRYKKKTEDHDSRKKDQEMD